MPTSVAVRMAEPMPLSNRIANAGRTVIWVMAVALAACGGRTVAPAPDPVPAGMFRCNDVFCRLGQFCVKQRESGGYDDPKRHEPYTRSVCEDAAPVTDPNQQCWQLDATSYECDLLVP